MTAPDMISNTFQVELKGIEIPIHRGKRILNEGSSQDIDIYKLGEGKRSAGVYLLKKANDTNVNDAFVIKFYEELTSYKNDTVALKQLHEVMDRNPGLSIGAVQEITPNLEVPGVLTGQHKANLDVHLNYIEGSSLNILWERLTEEFKSSFIESMKKLESCFKDMYSKNGFTVWTKLKTRKKLFSHNRPPTLRMGVTDPTGKCTRHCLHGGNFVLTKQHELFVIDPR